jgi:hypothetical protein
MAEAMDVVYDQTSHAFSELFPQNPRTFVEIHNRRDHFLCSGEFCCLNEPIQLVSIGNATDDGEEESPVVHSTVAWIIGVVDNLVLVNLMVQSSEFPDHPAPPPVPPNNRTYLEFPEELVWTDTIQKIPACQVKCEAFVFHESSILFGDGGMCHGMTNGFFVRMRFQRLVNHWQPIPNLSICGLYPFPHWDCYSKRAWENVLRLSRLISFELARSSIGQNTWPNKLIHYSHSDWSYLRYRLDTPTANQWQTQGVSTVLFPRKNGTKEIVKRRSEKDTYRFDTSSQFSELQGVLGSAITVGLRFPTPRAPDLPSRQVFAFGIRRASDNDTFNLFFPLPEESVDGTNYRPRHRGIDFKFDGKKALLRVSLRFRIAQPNDVAVRDLFGLAPLEDVEEDNGDEDSEATSENDDDEEDEEPPLEHFVNIRVNDLIGNDDYLLKVRRVLNLRTHVVVVVVESEHADFVVGSERVLTMVQAQALYVSYHDL